MAICLRFYNNNKKCTVHYAHVNAYYIRKQFTLLQLLGNYDVIMR